MATSATFVAKVANDSHAALNGTSKSKSIILEINKTLNQMFALISSMSNPHNLNSVGSVHRSDQDIYERKWVFHNNWLTCGAMHHVSNNHLT